MRGQSGTRRQRKKEEEKEQMERWHGRDGKKRGPRVELTELTKAAASKAAMVLKTDGIKPSAAAVIARCPRATLNPDTGKAFDEMLISNDPQTNLTCPCTNIYSHVC